VTTSSAWRPAPEQRDAVRSWPTPLDHTGLTAARSELAELVSRRIAGDSPVTETWLDCRYAGQSHELTVDSVDSFHDVHAVRNGYARRSDPVEVVAIRARATVPSPVAVSDLPAPVRAGGVGPAVIAEADCTIWVPPGWTAEPGEAGALVVRRQRNG
jgi:5-oxoprolinase (ATP-hydrolysing)